MGQSWLSSFEISATTSTRAAGAMPQEMPLKIFCSPYLQLGSYYSLPDKTFIIFTICISYLAVNAEWKIPSIITIIKLD